MYLYRFLKNDNDDYKTILQSRRNKWNELICRYAEKDGSVEDMNFTSLPEGENCDTNNFFLQDNEANLWAAKSKSSSKVKCVSRMRYIDLDLIPRNVRQNKRRILRKSVFKIENCDTIGEKIIKLDITKTHNFGFLKVNAEPKVKIKSTNRRRNSIISTNVRKSVFNIENIDKDASSEKLIKLGTTKTQNFGFVSKVNPELNVKRKSKNSRSNCSKDLSNFIDAKNIDINITFESMINNEDKTLFNNLNILHKQDNKGDKLTAFLNKSTSSVCQANSSSSIQENSCCFNNINSLPICQDNSLLPIEGFTTNTDEKLTTFRNAHKGIVSARDQHNINNSILNLHNTTFVKNETIISKSVNNIVLLDSSESEEENCIPEINSNISPQREIDKNFTNLKKDEISTNSFSACKPACSVVVQKYISAKTQNKCETNSDSDYDVWDDIFPTKKSRIGILM